MGAARSGAAGRGQAGVEGSIGAGWWGAGGVLVRRSRRGGGAWCVIITLLRLGCGPQQCQVCRDAVAGIGMQNPNAGKQRRVYE